MRYTREDGCRAWLTYAAFQPDLLYDLLQEFGTAEQIYDDFRADKGKALRKRIPQLAFDVLAERAEPDAMHQMMVTMQREQMQIVSVDDLHYPDSLRNIPDPPVYLFYRGNLDCLAGKCVTIVGSRSASPYALTETETLACELSRAGVTVISGLAMGIDTAAHTGCIDGGSPTAAVLGCGLDVPYPVENLALRDRILSSGGVLLSEFAPGSPGLPWHFPVRNRIMSGLSRAVVMMECRVRSGSMTTVNHALAQGREVYAHPGKIGTEWAKGAHQLLREGANYFTSAADILEDLAWQTHQPIRQEQPQQAEALHISDDQRRVLNAIGQEEKSYDELAAATGMDASALSGVLTMLQLQGLIRSLPGKQYARV